MIGSTAGVTAAPEKIIKLFSTSFWPTLDMWNLFKVAHVANLKLLFTD